MKASNIRNYQKKKSQIYCELVLGQAYKLQSVLGSIVKPKEIPQKPGKAAIAEALEL